MNQQEMIKLERLIKQVEEKAALEETMNKIGITNDELLEYLLSYTDYATIAEFEFIATTQEQAWIKNRVYMKNGRENIRDWYMKTFPEDELGAEIMESATFMKLFGALDRREDVYCMLADDSIIRERAFVRLAEIMNCDYDDIYKQWLRTA